MTSHHPALPRHFLPIDHHDVMCLLPVSGSNLHPPSPSSRLLNSVSCFTSSSLELLEIQQTEDYRPLCRRGRGGGGICSSWRCSSSTSTRSHPPPHLPVSVHRPPPTTSERSLTPAACPSRRRRPSWRPKPKEFLLPVSSCQGGGRGGADLHL